MADDGHNVMKFRLGNDSGNDWLSQVPVAILPLVYRRQNSGKRSAGSGLSFCTLLKGLTDSTVFIHHCPSTDVLYRTPVANIVSLMLLCGRGYEDGAV